MTTQETEGGSTRQASNPNLDSGAIPDSNVNKPATPYYIFEQCITRAKNLVSMHDSTINNGSISDAHYCDCYRAAIVLSISALDAYIRKVVVSQMRNILANPSKELNKGLSSYVKDLLNQDKLLDAARKSNLLDVVEDAVKEDFAKKSFQGEWKITTHLEMVGHGDIYSKVAVKANINEKNLKERLSRYTNRRHVIAHSGDYDLNQIPHQENEITKNFAQECIELVSLFVNTMNEIVESK